MTLKQLIQEKGLSRYSLSKSSGIPWATLADIYTGKTHMNRCSAVTLRKLSKALELSMEELLMLDIETKNEDTDGKPMNKEYLETDLPVSLKKAVDDYIQGEKEKMVVACADFTDGGKKLIEFAQLKNRSLYYRMSYGSFSGICSL